MKEPRKYHHGDLRAALLVAAEAELAESGIEGFSLRKVARRAGVSHAAPAHHFGDANGLLTALAARGYERLMALADLREPVTGQGPSQLTAYGLAYCDFAREYLPLFRLCFASDRPDFCDPMLSAVSTAAFDRLAQGAAAVSGGPAYGDVDAMADAYALWSMVHGLADLLASGRMKGFGDLPPEERDGHIAALLGRVLPGG
ncbi:MAG: TetR/AcrR family transcriptional regulator [Jannaschia sp.]